MNLLQPEDARKWAIKKFSSNYAAWFAGEGAWPLQLNLGTLTEAQAGKDLSAVRTWAQAWANVKGPWQLQHTERKWARLGTQTLPQYALVANVEDAVALAGETRAWALAKRRAEELILSWPQLTWPFLARQFSVLATYDSTEYERLCGVLRWLLANPHCEVFVRELPISGVDSKWVQNHQSVLAAFLRALLGSDEGDLHGLTGLKRNRHLVRLRILCPVLRQHFSGLCDISVPVEELAELRLQPGLLLIVENQATGLSLPDMPGVVAVMQMGRSVGALARIPWMQGIPSVYWGDLDTYGFVCLSQARQALPLTQSVLMDADTLLAHPELWAREDKQASDSSLVDHLTPDEREVYDGLKSQKWGQQVRLEQERIVWPHALAVLWEAHARLAA